MNQTICDELLGYKIKDPVSIHLLSDLEVIKREYKQHLTSLSITEKNRHKYPN